MGSFADEYGGKTVRQMRKLNREYRRAEKRRKKQGGIMIRVWKFFFGELPTDPFEEYK